jgi:hypothetical protein
MGMVGCGDGLPGHMRRASRRGHASAAWACRRTGGPPVRPRA